MRNERRIVAAIALSLEVQVPGAYAVDGVMLINQDNAMAGGVTPGDAPGFPVTISQPGSYKLSGNLTVPDANTTAIEIASDHVTIDLNGFSITGPVDCSNRPCSGLGTGNGISTRLVNNTNYFNITIRNGTIQGLGGSGIDLVGDSFLVEYMHVRSNGGNGIRLGQFFGFSSNGIVKHNNAHRNGNYGIIIGGGLVSDNVATQNLNNGIAMSVKGSVVHNVSMDHAFGSGLILGAQVSYIGNVLSGNLRAVEGGINQGQNLCGNAACPDAQF